MTKQPKKAKVSAAQKQPAAVKAPSRAEPAAKSVVARSPAPAALASPFGTMRRFADEMDRLFDDFRTSLFPRLDFSRMEAAWAPPVEVSERGGQLVIRAELPGLAKKDVRVEIREDAVTIEGERRREREEKRKGFYRSERSYGSFFRQIPLPEGIDSTSAKATFKDGVLEVTMPAPPRPTKGRTIPIAEE
jgi:HSP20 family protein